LHLILINFHSINYEYTFSEGAKFLIDFDRKTRLNAEIFESIN